MHQLYVGFHRYNSVKTISCRCSCEKLTQLNQRSPSGRFIYMVILCSKKIKRAEWQLWLWFTVQHRVTKVRWRRRLLSGYRRRTALLPFPVHRWRLPWGNSQYWAFGHLVSVVSCQIPQIRPHLVAHGWQITENGYRQKCCVCTAAGGWRGLRKRRLDGQ